MALHAHGNTLLLKGRPLQRAAARSAAVLQALDHRPGRRPPHRRAAAAGRRDAQHHARAVGRAHASPTSRPASSAARWRCSAGRSTTPIDMARSGKARQPPGPAGDRRADPPRRQGRADRAPRSHAQARPDAGLQADALHQLAGLRPVGRDQLVPPRHHDARLPAAEALAGAAAGLGQQGREHEAGDVRRGAPRPADGRAGAQHAATSRCATRCSSAACSRCSTA